LVSCQAFPHKYKVHTNIFEEEKRVKKLITICVTDILIIALISTASLANGTDIDITPLLPNPSPWLTNPIDITPPLPNPSQWLTVPYQYGPDAQGYYHHAMSAVLTSDATTGGSEPCQYYFQFVYGGYGPHDSGWQSSNVYDYAVSSNPAQYGVYRVKARDAAGNETGWSGMLSTSP
jgi:hypothetical protein